MNDDELIKVVKEVGSDVNLLGDFLGKLSLYILRTTNADKFSVKYETTPSDNNKVIYGELKFKED